MQSAEGYGLTRGRKIILELLKKTYTHPTAKEVHHAVLQEGHKLSQATVYNSLDYLVEEGLVRRLAIDSEIAHFDGRLDRHDHLHCRACGNISDAQIYNDRNISVANDFLVEDISLIVRGLCANCK
jgi:Fur family transcriptional regulator, peroxide stress response regulator